MRHRDLASNVAWPEQDAISRLRLLDFDDLYLLTHLLEGQTIAATAKQLGLTQPAVTQRVRKIERVFTEPLLTKVGRHVRLTPQGREVCGKAAEALALMQSVGVGAATRRLTVAADPELLRTWLARCIVGLRADRAAPVAVHAICAVDGAWPDLLAAGQIDAALTVCDDTPDGAEGHIIAELEHVLVAGAELAAKLSQPSELQACLLLERDPSYPLSRRIEAGRRGRLRFGETWFLGGDYHVLGAAIANLGVAVLPTYVAHAALAAGSVVPVLPEIDVTAAALRLICRPGLKDDGTLTALLSRLRGIA